MQKKSIVKITVCVVMESDGLEEKATPEPLSIFSIKKKTECLQLKPQLSPGFVRGQSRVSLSSATID